MWSVPLRVSCPGPVLRLACLGGGRSGPGSPLLGLGLRGRRLGVPGGVPSSAGVSYVGYESCPEGGAVRRPRAVHAPGVGTGEGAGWGALDRRLTCTGVSGGQ